MTWIKLDDKAPRHPKISGLSDRAFRWWVLALCYASEFLTDGVLPATFWKQTPKQARAELANAGLWVWADPVFYIHDYLSHQQSREAVESERRRNRDRRNSDRGTTERRTTGTTSGRTGEKPRPEIEKEVPEKPDHSTTKHRGGGLIVGPGEYARLLESHAFVGAKLRVPKVLHAELIAKSGANADAELRAWYDQLDEELEQSGKATGDVFTWLRPRHQTFAVSKGWIDAAPKPSSVVKPFSVADALARKAGAK